MEINLLFQSNTQFALLSVRVVQAHTHTLIMKHNSVELIMTDDVLVVIAVSSLGIHVISVWKQINCIKLHEQCSLNSIKTWLVLVTSKWHLTSESKNNFNRQSIHPSIQLRQSFYGPNGHNGEVVYDVLFRIIVFLFFLLSHQFRYSLSNSTMHSRDTKADAIATFYQCTSVKQRMVLRWRKTSEHVYKVTLHMITAIA